MKKFKTIVNKRINKGVKLNQLLNYIASLNEQEGKEFISSKRGWKIAVNISQLRENNMTNMREDLCLIEEILDTFFKVFLDDFCSELDSII